MRDADERYFERIESRLDEAFAVAREAKQRGGDPKPDVEIPVAKDMADRVENILGIEGVAERVRELEGEMSREEATLALAEDFAEGRVGEYESTAGVVEGAVRTAVALLTEGVVAAPIEGIDRVEVLDNSDGTEFVRVFYAGPIRSAGGTAQALSVLVADYTRTLLGLDQYKPYDEEVERYAEEVDLYDSETGLQYSPKDKETKFIAEHCPIMLDGEATGQEEVSGFRDLERVDTNNPRGGMCLVLAEGIAQKAPKIKRYTTQLDEVDWPWLDDLIEGTIGGKDTDEETNESSEDDSDGDGDDVDDDETDQITGPPRVEPATKFLRDLIAGRPVFSHPCRAGGFRLRYGRARNHGFATAGVHPATMHLVDDFLATGTQIKTERPGKAAGVVPVDTIEGPTVRLANGDVRRVEDLEEARTIRNGVEAILDLGEYLVNYGEFVENNHPLSPASYTVEWWVQDLDHAGADIQMFRDDPHVDLSEPNAAEAIGWTTDYDAPLHPKYTYLWHDLTVKQFERLANAVSEGRLIDAADSANTLVVPRTETVCNILETLLVQHTQNEETVTVPDALALVRSLGLTEQLERSWSITDLSDEARTWGTRAEGSQRDHENKSESEQDRESKNNDNESRADRADETVEPDVDGQNAIKAVNEVAPFTVRERAPTRIGNRMGRPEKSEKRELSPAVHTLFPIGEAGGNQRDVTQAASHTESMQSVAGQVEVQIARRECTSCDTATFKARCPECNDTTRPVYKCRDCDVRAEPDEAGRAECPRCGSLASPVERRPIDVAGEYRDALAAVNQRAGVFDILKGVKGLTSEQKIAEPIEKGVLRAKHGVSTFKDGTIRYDMTDLPVTAVRPTELDVTAGQFRSLGYETDIDGEPLRHDDQLVELRVQDIVLSDGAAVHMLRTADFVDDLLEQYYGLEPFYEVETRDDLVGELVFGMAPHTSAAVVGRVVGFTSAAVGYAHPYFHAAKRRNCFHPETKIWYKGEDDRYRYERIETVVEARLDDPRSDDFGTLIQDLDGALCVPSISNDGEMGIQPVSAVSKHPAPDHLVAIETNDGRTLRVTPDHTVLRWSDEIERVSASEVKPGDNVLHPESVDFEGEPVSFDLLAECLAHDGIENDKLRITGLGHETKQLERRLGDEKSSERHPTWTEQTDRDGVPVSTLLEQYDESTLLSLLPTDISLSVEDDRTSVDRWLEIDSSFASLLGYYAASGFVREEADQYRTVINLPHKAAQNATIQTFREALGVEAAGGENERVTVASRIVSLLLCDVLACGSGMGDKCIPDCVMGAPAGQLQSFLTAHFNSNGNTVASPSEISVTTVSDQLKEDLLGALRRFGITGRVSRDTRTPEGDVGAAFSGDDPQTVETWIVHITDESAIQFTELIGTDSDETEWARASLDSNDQRGRPFVDGSTARVDEVTDVRYVESDTDHTYCLTVADTHTLVANDLHVGQCDGDEDCVMLLMDGLLNFSKLYLPDKRGGSVTEDSQLLAFGPEGAVRCLTFEEFWTQLDSPVEHDGKFQKKICLEEGWTTYAFDENHEAAPKPIEKAIRYRAGEDEQLLRVETQFGRSLEITANHSLFRYDDGIEDVAGDDLEEGDVIVAPRRLEVETIETTIDVTDCIDSPYVFVDDPADTADDDRSTNRQKLPFEMFSTPETTHDHQSVPDSTEVGSKESEIGINRYLPVDVDFAWFLGYVLANGSLSDDNPTLTSSEESITERILEVSTTVLGCSPSVEQSETFSEVRFPAVFKDVLNHLGIEETEADSRANDSDCAHAVPDCILRAERRIILSFLRGFIDDGEDDNDSSVEFDTTSEAVKDGIVFLLHRLGLVADIAMHDQEESEQSVYTLTASRGASDSRQQDDDGTEPLTVRIPSALEDLREMDIRGVEQLIPASIERDETILVDKLSEIVAELDQREVPTEAAHCLDELRPLVEGDLSYLRITNIEQVDYSGYLYDLQVGGEPIFTANWLYAHNSMDAPLVMSSRIDPTEIDDEAHNVDIVDTYPREFYEATRRMADPGEVDITIAEETLGTDDEYSGFKHTHDTTDLAAGPDLSAYKTLESMMDKMDAQLELARKLRAVDETDVAERVIEYHFLPDLIGNLRAFSRQDTRCLDCGVKYRRMPLTGSCRECDGRVTLTVHEGSVNKYLDTAIHVAEEFGCREYTKQRLDILRRRLESIFENDKNKQSGIEDFM
ncbi:LAGLIDADG family homing endonuclease [Halocatena marina]|uniref:LAGLIDADG family homing endonuclease n=1 Tax=Halocatena marina TaxID=2934937 RepID=UPI00200CC825|nr:LAGLIDADG family homing endonuclease [Halocatena marina]